MTRRSIWRAARRSRRVFWYSGRDSVAHARWREADARTLCGEVAILPSLAWPYRERCHACVRATLEDQP